MIEDALKSTRTLHRLFMTVALVTVIFGLSISLPEDKMAQKTVIDGVIAIDFAAYDVFVAQKVAEEAAASLVPIGEAINKALEDGGCLTFNLDKIGEAFKSPLHVGQILRKDLVLNDINNALNGLSLTQDVQILVPRTDGLVAEIKAFLSENQGDCGKLCSSCEPACRTDRTGWAMSE